MKIVTVFLLTFLTLPAFAADNTAATDLFYVLNMDKLLAQKAVNYKKQMIVVLENTDISDDERADLEQEYTVLVDKVIAFLRTDEVLEAFKQSYSETFTEAEIQDLVDFYSSPTGKKFLSHSGELNATFMKKISPKFNALIKELEQID